MGEGCGRASEEETMGEGVAKLHRRKPCGKGVAESHKRKPWWKRVTKTYKETMGEGCRNNEGGMRLPFKYLEFKDSTPFEVLF